MVLFVLAVIVMPLAGREAAGAGLIRDTEVENTILSFGTPLFEGAGLLPSDVRIFIVNDDNINAFVAGGMNLFVNTGLLMSARNAGELNGVIAHETGHIQGGHLSRIGRRMRTSSTAALVSTVLGVLTALAGAPDAGIAIVAGGQGIAVGSLLAYSRAQESAADQAAFKLLDLTGQSAKGMASFFKTLEDQELLPPERQDIYVRTHPITRQRIRDAESHVSRSPHSGATTPPRIQEMFKRMQAKLSGFLYPPSRTFATYRANDKSVVARYARAVAHYRANDLGRALPLIDGLIRQEPKNPYFYELKGQALLEAGRIGEALDPYRKAARLAPDAPLIRVDLARTQIATNDGALLKAAVRNLVFATRQNPENSTAWHHLGIAYGKRGEIGKASLALAETALIRRKPKDALYHAGRAERKLPKGTNGWIRAQDIKRAAHEAIKKKRNKGR
jgi:predicted Zn-dependent protease